MSTSTDTSTVINKYYEAANMGDWNTWVSLFDENAVVDEQLGGHIEGIGTLRGAIDHLKKGYSRFQNKPRFMVINGDEACVISHISAANASGVPIEANVGSYFRVENGKIKYMTNAHDTVPFAPFVNQRLS